MGVGTLKKGVCSPNVCTIYFFFSKVISNVNHKVSIIGNIHDNPELLKK